MFYRLTKEQQQQMIEEIQQFFLQEKDEDLSEFAAERVLDFLKNHSPLTFTMQLSKRLNPC